MLLIVIVNFRVPALVIDCLRSINQELRAVPDTSVVVFENGSGDDSARLIAKAIASNKWDAWCKLMVSDQNLGFTGGNNIPISESLKTSTPPCYILLLNPDTIIRPGALRPLIDFLERNSQVGIVGSRLEDPDGTPQRSAFRFKSPLGELEGSAGIGFITKLLKRYVVAPPVCSQNLETDWVAGASMMVRTRVFEEIGLLDEGFFTYYDDIDFCLAARRAGWMTWYVPESRVVHLVGQSTGVDNTPRRLPKYLLEARRRFYLKNYGALFALMADTCLLCGILISKFRSLVTLTPSQLPPKIFVDSFLSSVFVRGAGIDNVRAPETTTQMN
ncbi:glycosyltransferase family 2 protein [Bradyrhizobium ganzhouense]|uniref:glycosyltransferase family 2 protein n=1 Tax=Bradyrhizobium ganzhouense TaxID=1179767 RepID=UPI003CF49694